MCNNHNKLEDLSFNKINTNITQVSKNNIHKDKINWLKLII